MPWRETADPYLVLVSEVMLQQTQVARVAPAYERFVQAFPDVGSLASAPLEQVLREWRGLGYNRRAVALKRAAQSIAREHGGRVPESADDLLRLPGVGPVTAAGVAAFAYGTPGVYIETNVRAALLHEFFPGEAAVTDAELRPVYEAVMDSGNPREWLYALMDYGAHVKKLHANPARRSAHHYRQSRFEGSWRQKRARALNALVDAAGSVTPALLAERIDLSAEEARRVLGELEAEGFVVREGGDAGAGSTDRFRVA